MKNIKKILAINFGGIGDEIFFLPALISLKKEYPDSEITLALEPRSKGIKDLTNIIDNILQINIKEGSKYAEMLKLLFFAWRGRYDAVISSGGNKLISLLLFLTGIKHRYGYNTGFLSKLLLTDAVTLNKQQYACKMYHDLVKNLTNYNTELPEINIEKAEKIPNSVLIHPGVSKMSIKKGCIKTIPAKTWAKTIDLLVSEGKKVMLAGGPDDDECINEILKNTETNNFENLYGSTKNLKDLAKLISSAEIFLCSDSAPLHIAVALGVKTFAIFGPTDDSTLLPDSDMVTAIKAVTDCPLRPCLWNKRLTTCDELSCLNITPNQIVSCINS